MTTKKINNIETPIQYSFWSYCLVVVSIFVLADVISGGFLRESLVVHVVEYSVFVLAMIATLGAYALNGVPGARFVRFYSRHKL